MENKCSLIFPACHKLGKFETRFDFLGVHSNFKGIACCGTHQHVEKVTA
jgi:hypothetical protein